MSKDIAIERNSNWIDISVDRSSGSDDRSCGSRDGPSHDFKYSDREPYDSGWRQSSTANDRGSGGGSARFKSDDEKRLDAYVDILQRRYSRCMATAMENGAADVVAGGPPLAQG